MGYHGGLLLSVCLEDVVKIYIYRSVNIENKDPCLKLCPVFCHAVASNLTQFI